MKDKEFKSMLNELKKIVKKVSEKISEGKLIALISLSAKAQLELKHNCRDANEYIKNEMETEIRKTRDVRRKMKDARRKWQNVRVI